MSKEEIIGKVVLFKGTEPSQVTKIWVPGSKMRINHVTPEGSLGFLLACGRPCSNKSNQFELCKDYEEEELLNHFTFSELVYDKVKPKPKLTDTLINAIG